MQGNPDFSAAEPVGRIEGKRKWKYSQARLLLTMRSDSRDRDLQKGGGLV